MELTKRLVRFATDLKFSDLPKKVIIATKKVTLDLLGTMLAGSTAPGSNIVVDLVRSYKGKEESTVFAYGNKVPAPMAAFANGTMGHALDFDDTHDRAVLHTSVCVIPAALAVAEKMEATGKDFITGATLGMDIHCRMGLAAKEPITTTGWIYTATMGTFGCAFAASKILGLDEEEMLNAIGISYSETSGNMQTVIEGTLAKRLQPGLAAMSGILAALLAQKGFTGPKHALEGKYGFYNVYHKGNYDSRKLIEGLGDQFEVLNLSVKPYPCCRHTHTSIDAILEVKRKYDVNPKDVECIEVGVNKSAYSGVCEPSNLKYNPLTIVDAQFSVPYVVACALVNGKVFIEDFTNDAIKRRNILEVARKVNPYVDPALEKTSSRMITPATIKVKMKSGEIHTVFVEAPKGSPGNQMTGEEICEKFRSCASRAVRPLTNKKIDEVIGIISNLEEVKNIKELTKLFI